MAAILPKDGQLFLADSLRLGFQFQPSVGLWVNDDIPTVDDELSDYLEATYPGYARQLLAPWDDAIINAQGVALLVTSAPRIFSLAALPGQNIFGYFLVANDWVADTRLVLVERFPAKVPLLTIGPELVLFNGFTLGSFFGNDAPD